MNLVSLLGISFYSFLTQTAPIFRLASEGMLYKNARWSLNCYNKKHYSADIHQIWSQKPRLAAVLSRNRFETNFLKLHVVKLNNETRRMRHFMVPRALLRTYCIFSLYVCHHLFFVIRKESSYIIKNAYMACNIRKMAFLTIESANKAEINISLARDTTRLGPQARASWVMLPQYIKGSIARDFHLGLRTNLAPLADTKYILV